MNTQAKQKLHWSLFLAAGVFVLTSFSGRHGLHAQPVESSSDRTVETERTVTEKVTTIREREEIIIERQRAGRPVTVAIFVKNRDADIPDDRVAVFEDYVAARLMDDGFKIIRREDVLNSVKDFATEGPNRGADLLPGAALDQMLSNNTSASRLAENMGAEFLLNCTISSFDTETASAAIPGGNMETSTTTMSVTYNVLYAADGAGFKGDVIDVTRKYTTASGKLPRASFDAMLRESAKELAAVAKRDVVQRMPVPVRTAEFPIEIVCRIANFDIPEVTKDPQGQYQIGAIRRLEVQNANVIVDGIQIGTTPGPLSVKPGLHKLRITREGFEDYEATVRFTPGVPLNIDLRMKPAEEVRMLQRAAVFEALKENRQVSDATQKAIEGYAQMLTQSGYKIDIKSDAKVNLDYVQHKVETSTTQQSSATTKPASN